MTLLSAVRGAVVELKWYGKDYDAPTISSVGEASRTLSVDQCSIVRCYKGGYWKNNRTKFIKVTKVKNYIFKYKDEAN